MKDSKSEAEQIKEKLEEQGLRNVQILTIDDNSKKIIESAYKIGWHRGFIRGALITAAVIVIIRYVWESTL